MFQSYFPFQERGGPVFKVRALATGLAKRGHQVTVLTADLGFGKGNGFHAGAERCRWGWTVRSDNVEAIYLTTTARYRAVTLNPGVFPFCRASLRDYEVAHRGGWKQRIKPTEYEEHQLSQLEIAILDWVRADAPKSWCWHD